jgi:DNA-binding MarR family transcriptional regulator
MGYDFEGVRAVLDRCSDMTHNYTLKNGKLGYQDLLAYRLLVLSNTLGKGAMRFYAGRLNASLAEWRLLAALNRNAPISVNALSAEMRTDKGWISRTANALTERGYVSTRRDDSDARKLILELTPQGKALYKSTLPAVLQRQEHLVSGLSSRELEAFERTLAKLQQRADEMLGDAEI